MTLVAPHLADMVIDLMTVVVAEVMAEMILTATVDLAMTGVEIEVTADAIATMDMLLVVLIAMPVDAMTAIAAVVEMIAVVVEVVTLIAMTVVVTVVETAVVTATVDAHPEMLLHLPPMVTQLLAERAGSHTEVETMMRDTPVVTIDR
jgi:hypothetical protein